MPIDDAIRAFFTGIVDYAGFFPPAKLRLPEAFANYLAYGRCEDAWMLGRFICPAAKLGELAPHLGGEAAELSVIAGPDDLTAVAAFVEEHEGKVRVGALESKVPDAAAAADHVARFEDTRAEAGFRDVPVFYEAPWPEVFGRLAEAGAGLKIRCGGPSRELFPSVETLAALITGARECGIFFKATAGLHHPFRHENPELSVMEHGFVNVFGAAMVAEEGEAAVREVLATGTPESFAFGDGLFRVGDRELSADRIREVRAGFAVSFGSCSFDEPREDLRRVSWL